MLRKLRLKFIVINMLFVTLMLGFIFSFLYYATRLNMERVSYEMLETLSLNPPIPSSISLPDSDDITASVSTDVRLPYFSIYLNRAGEATEVSGDLFDLSDKEDINELITHAFENHTDRGELTEYHLRFMRTDERIIFTDISSETTTLNHLAQTIVLAGIAAFFVFLGISILLSHWAVKPVENAWNRQKQFVADASHELKTPLTVISTDAELLHGPDCSVQDREQLSDSIMTMSHQMRGLVESMLDLARVENKTDKKEMQVLNFSEIVSTATMQFEPLFFEKGYFFREEITPDLQVRGNLTQLKQLVDILLDNAGKYTLEGGNIRLYLRNTPKKKLQLEVSNDAHPLSEEDMQHLFDRFYRVDQSRSMNHSYGLGLSIARTIAEDHHGKIRVECDDHAVRFLVDLPLHTH